MSHDARGKKLKRKSKGKNYFKRMSEGKGRLDVEVSIFVSVYRLSSIELSGCCADTPYLHDCPIAD